MAVRLALWGGLAPLAMVSVLVSKPHVQVSTLRFIITRFGDVPEMPFLTKASTRNGSLTAPRLAEGFLVGRADSPGGMTWASGHEVVVPPALGGRQGQVATVSMRGLWDVQGPRRELMG